VAKAPSLERDPQATNITPLLCYNGGVAWHNTKNWQSYGGIACGHQVGLVFVYVLVIFCLFKFVIYNKT
jgi:hypothetical protein